MSVRSRIAVPLTVLAASIGLAACGGGGGEATKDDLRQKLEKENAPAAIIPCLTDTLFEKLSPSEVRHLIDAENQSDATDKEVEALQASVVECSGGDGTTPGTATGGTDTGTTATGTDTGSPTDTGATVTDGAGSDTSTAP